MSKQETIDAIKALTHLYMECNHNNNGELGGVTRAKLDELIASL